MRIGIVVDSACDLPPDFIQRNNIVVLPITARIGEAMLADHRDQEATLEFLRSHVADRGHEAETSAYSVAQIHALFLQQLVLDYDYVFCLTLSRLRSQMYENASQATIAILNDYKRVRQQSGHVGPFALRVIDTLSLFAGQAVSAVEAVRMRKAGSDIAQMRSRLELLAENTYAYIIPNDLYYLRARGRSKGDRSISLFDATLGNALDIKPLLRVHHGETAVVARLKGFASAARQLFQFTANKVREGLITPTVCIGYGGELTELHAFPGYGALRAACAEADVEVLESVMSLTGMINVGKGALSIGFASAAHRYY